MSSASVLLWNLVDREIADICVRRELGLERSSNTTKLVPDDALEEWMLFDLRGTIMCTAFSTKPVVGIAKETTRSASSKRRACSLLSDHIFCLTTQYQLIWKVQGLAPVDNLAVCVMGVFRTERRPSDKAFEHDSSDRPPVTEIGVSLVQEDLGCNIVRSSHGRIGHVSSRLAPCIDKSPIADREIDLLVQGDRIPIPRSVALC